MRIKLNKLTLVGDQNNYEVNFKNGLNFITGPISTGKSTILELIDYCLGKKKHKNYDEVRLTCKYVSLDLVLNGNRYLIERPLFSFELPVKIHSWNIEENVFSKDFDYKIITQPKEENSYSRFLQEELEIPELKISGQTFSFRDLFKYSYISQTKIDSENILDEKKYTVAFKRKPTFEIILNSLNLLLNELKNQKKEQNTLVTELLNQKNLIVKFLQDVELFLTKKDTDKRRINLIYKRNTCITDLNELKKNGKLKNNNTKFLETSLFENRQIILDLKNQKEELNKYIAKLNLLRNQYSNEIIKIDYLILSNGKLKMIEFDSCPSCNNELPKKDFENCNLCGQELSEFSDSEEKAIKNERKRINSRLNSLIIFIESQRDKLINVTKDENKITLENYNIEQKIDLIQNKFISPYIEKIETLNREIGELDKQIENLDLSANVQDELNILSDKIQKEENKLAKIIIDIKEIEDEHVDFNYIIQQLSTIYTKILGKFNFPKLNNSYINEKSYLPYVRNSKYDDIGSLGAVTLVNMAYFLSILELSLSLKKSYHPGILILDTVGKNLGTREKNPDENDEFKDSVIFKSVLKFLVDFSSKYQDKVQIIVVNNDYTDAIDDSDIIAHFDGLGTGNLPYGLINDITN